MTLDEFGRAIESLSKDRNNNFLAKTTSSYHLSSTTNYVEKCAYYDSGFTQSICSREYKDSLGRTVRKVVPGIDGETQKYLVTAKLLLG